jgi:hypothetical protein
LASYRWLLKQALKGAVGLDACAMMDLGFSGPKLTWSNKKKRAGLAKISERLDRAWCNLGWRHLFQGAGVHHLPRTHSDHHPVLVDCEAIHAFVSRKRPVRMEAAWFIHPQFEELVKSSWEMTNWWRPLMCSRSGYSIGNT